MSFAAQLDRLATLSRKVNSVGTSLQVNKTFSPALANVPICVIPVSSRLRADYSVRQQEITHKIITTTNLDTATSLLGGAVGGARLGDQWSDGANVYLVEDYYVEGNATICVESLYVSIVKLIRP